MAHSRRIAVHARATPQRCAREEQEKVPWATIVLLILALVMILALWGKLPSHLNQLHQAPRGNAPAGSALTVPARLTRA